MSTSVSPPSAPDTAVSRRTLARGLAWTAPVALVGVAAPAHATSAAPCGPNVAAYRTDTTPGSPTYSAVTQLLFIPSMLTATVAYEATNGDGTPRTDATPGGTGWVYSTDFDSDTTPDWDYIKLHLNEPLALGQTVTMTITFPQPVSNLSLRITDIDGHTSDWIDEVTISPAGSVVVPGANVIGAGTTVDPYRSKVDGGIDESPMGDLELLWDGPLSIVKITYRAGDAEGESEIGQHIGVGQIRYGCPAT